MLPDIHLQQIFLHENRSILLFRAFQRLNKLRNVVTIDRADITVAERFKKHCRQRKKPLRNILGAI